MSTTSVPTPVQTVPTVTVKLPSRGVLYNNLIPDGKVSVRKLLVSEMSVLEAQGSGGVERLDAVIRACCKLPLPGIVHANLLITDRFAIMLALRTFTFGPHYNYQFKCQFCNQVSKATTNIAEDLEEHTAADDLTEPIDCVLTDAGKIVGLRFLRGEDEERVVKYAKRMKMQSNDAGDPSNIYRMAIQIVNIDGEINLELRQRETFVKGLTAADSLRIHTTIDEKEPGLDLTVFPDCRNCGATNEMSLPFTAEFFRPTNL